MPPPPRVLTDYALFRVSLQACLLMKKPLQCLFVLFVPPWALPGMLTPRPQTIKPKP